MKHEAKLCRLHTLAKIPIVSESRLVRDLTMPIRDWSRYDSPACDRRTAKVVRLPFRAAAIRRQAS